MTTKVLIKDELKIIEKRAIVLLIVISELKRGITYISDIGLLTRLTVACTILTIGACQFRMGV